MTDLPDLPPRAGSTFKSPRKKTSERGYSRGWERVRLAKLAADPVCELRIVCRGLVATEVHHVESIRKRPDLRLEWTNLKSSCGPCHRAIEKARGNAGIENTHVLASDPSRG
jgi:5-methylcytosine-specific restriction endonuclease McrA